MDASRAERQALEGFYGEFSLRVGLRDWQVTNARHEQLKLLVADTLRGARRGVRILDVGMRYWRDDLLHDALRYRDRRGLQRARGSIGRSDGSGCLLPQPGH